MNGLAEEVRLNHVREALARHAVPVIDVKAFRSGVDCWVDLVRMSGAPDAVVRTARFERLVTRYEGLVDFGPVLEKEVAVAELLRRNGVRTPKILAWHRSDDPDREPSWMLAELIPHMPVDEVPVAAHAELGRTARQIHRIEPVGAEREHIPPTCAWGPWICERVRMRLEAARRYVPLPPAAELDHAVSKVLNDREHQARSLLHLDFRAPNLAFAGDRLVAVFDFANAVVGDPYLELARIRGCGLLTPDFIAGYGVDPGALARHASLLDAYELDLVALLVVVSREEFDDPALHRRMTERLALLAEHVRTGLPTPLIVPFPSP